MLLSTLVESIWEGDEEDSGASKKAKELGLVYQGWGKYGQGKDSDATHISKNGELVPIGGDQPTPDVAASPTAAPKKGADTQTPQPKPQSAQTGRPSANTQPPGAPAPQPAQAPAQEPQVDPEVQAQADMLLTLAASPEKALERAEASIHSLENQVKIIRARGPHARKTKTYLQTVKQLIQTKKACELLRGKLANTSMGQSSPPAHPPEQAEHVRKVLSAATMKSMSRIDRQNFLPLLKTPAISGDVTKLLEFLTRKTQTQGQHTNMPAIQLKKRLEFLIKQSAEQLKSDAKLDADYEAGRDYGSDDYKHFSSDD